MIKKIRNWVKDKAGVSPIIAIILMVAITIVLAATIYLWVSGLGGGGAAKTFPTIKMTDADEDLSDSTHDDDLVVLEHRGGDTINWGDYTIKVYENGTLYRTINPSGSFSVLDTYTITEDGTNDVTAGSEIKVIIIEKSRNVPVFEYSVVVS